LDVIEYYNRKLQFFGKLEEALDLSREEDYEFFMQIQPEKNRLWNMLDSLNEQLVVVQEEISNLEFDQFVLKNRFAAEDEAAAQADLDRQRGWLEDAEAVVTELEGARDALKQADGTVQAADQAEFDRLDGQVRDAKTERDGLQGAVEGFEADQR
jgi:hypothetical protein